MRDIMISGYPLLQYDLWPSTGFRYGGGACENERWNLFTGVLKSCHSLLLGGSACECIRCTVSSSMTLKFFEVTASATTISSAAVHPFRPFLASIPIQSVLRSPVRLPTGTPIKILPGLRSFLQLTEAFLPASARGARDQVTSSQAVELTPD